MANLRKLSRVDIVLIIIVVVGAVIIFPLSQGNASTKEEKIGLERRAKTAELSLSDVEKKATLESLRQHC